MTPFPSCSFLLIPVVQCLQIRPSPFPSPDSLKDSGSSGFWTLPPQAGAAKVLVSLKRAELIDGLYSTQTIWVQPFFSQLFIIICSFYLTQILSFCRSVIKFSLFPLKLIIFVVSCIWSKHTEHIIKTATGIMGSTSRPTMSEVLNTLKKVLFTSWGFSPKFSIYLTIYFSVIPYHLDYGFVLLLFGLPCIWITFNYTHNIFWVPH